MRTEDFLIEIGTEELPPSFLKALIVGFADNLRHELTVSGFGFKNLESYGTARRLAIIVRSLKERQADKESEKRGPAVSAAYNQDGTPTPALHGFMRACGITDPNLLERLKSKKGELSLIHI